MYPIRIGVILFVCVMVHLQRVFDKLLLLHKKLCLYKSVSRNTFLVLSHESFIYSVKHCILFWSC